jgi:cell division protein FtsI/penicillin-binding protein 2
VASPPGSTFKLVVASANMRYHVLPPDEIVPTGAAWDFGGHLFHNWSALPPQNLPQAIAWSNNVYFYKLAWQLGVGRLVKTAHDFGVGRPTGIDLPGESSGYLGTPTSVKQMGATWYPGSTVLLGIGQGYLAVTPLQDARWTAAVATGTLVTPHLGLAFRSSRNSFTRLAWPDPHKMSFRHELGPVRDGMRQVVTNGTALLLRDLPDAGGKTGTAEDASAGGQGLDSWLTAVAPMKAPKIAGTALIRGQGDGHPSSEVIRSAMAYFFAHENAILATGPAN